MDSRYAFGGKLLAAFLTLALLAACGGGKGSNANAPADAGAIEECEAYVQTLATCDAHAGPSVARASAPAREALRARLIASATDDASRERLRAKCVAGQKLLASSCP